jgi:adenosylhomocysteine nucleosidase
MTLEAYPDPMLTQVGGLAPEDEMYGAWRRLRTSGGMIGVATSSGRIRRGSWTSHRNHERWAHRSEADTGIVAVVGLQFEARIIAGPTVRAVVLGSAPTPLVTLLLPTDRGVISFGICGGLAPGLAPGACVIASSISDGTRAWATDKAWTKSLARLIPNATVGPILGVDAPVADVASKSSLHKRYGAVAVDMESHIAALAASAHGLPFAAVRAVADDAACAVMAVALAGRRPDGSVNVAGVLAALRRRPGELAPLIRLAMRTGSARATLVRLCRSLGAELSTPRAAPAEVAPEGYSAPAA